METKTTNERKRLGRPPYTFMGEELLTVNVAFRATETEVRRIDKQAKLLDVSRTDVLRGFINTLPDEPQAVQDGVQVYLNKVPVLLSRRDAKQLLKELTEKLLAGV